MAERRMFAKSIVTADKFLDLPATTQMLYFHLGVVADDDGFINNPKTVCRTVGATTKDLARLVESGYLIAFPSGVMVITHWLIHNRIQRDRYKPTLCVREWESLWLRENKSYTDKEELGCVRFGSKLDTQARKDKPSIDKSSSAEGSEGESDHPKLSEVMQYCMERQNSVDPMAWYNYYCARGFQLNGQPMVDWKASIRSWEGKENYAPKGGKNSAPTAQKSNRAEMLSYVQNLQQKQ